MTQAMEKLESLFSLMEDNGDLIRGLINKHVAEVIGEDERQNPLKGDFFIILARNGLRLEMRKRTGLEQNSLKGD
jgi:hypothetical protein